MKPELVKRLELHLMQHRLAVGAQYVAALAGIFGAIRHGIPAVLLGAAGYWLFGLARPGYDAELSRDIDAADDD